MIIATRQYGQLGNRLRLYAHLMAAAIEYDVTLYFPHLNEYACYFPSVANDYWCRYPRPSADQSPASSENESKTSDLVRRLICKQVYLTGRVLSHLRLERFPAHVVRLRHRENCILHEPEFRRQAQSRRPVLVAGWKFRSAPLLAKHAAAVRTHFQIAPEHQANIQESLAPLRRTGKRIVGVHIRHGDYRTWKDGRYYYPIEDYAATMRLIAEQNQAQQTTFLVCGNSNLTQQDFAGLDVHFPTGHLIEDMYSLAEVDLIIGPPSTFSAWSAFMGQVPCLRMLRRRDRKTLVDPAMVQSVLHPTRAAA